MTLARIHDTSTELQPVRSSIEVWAESARQAATVATTLAGTPFVPQSLRATRVNREETDDDLNRRTAANVTAAILTGQEIGLEPMAALRSIDVVQGTPALRAIALRAVVLAAGHDLWVKESTETRAVVCGRRRGSDNVQQSVWSLDRARALGLSGKDNWRKQPGAMLVARATSECARLVAADAILGVPYSVEEISDGAADTADASTVEQPAPERRTAQRRTKPQATPVQSVVPVDDAPPPPEPDFEPSGMDEFATETTSNPDGGTPITGAQLTKMQAGFNAAGIKDRDARLEVTKQVVRRELETSKDLTKAEASAVIDYLETLNAPDDDALFGGAQ